MKGYTWVVAGVSAWFYCAEGRVERCICFGNEEAARQDLGTTFDAHLLLL